MKSFSLLKCLLFPKPFSSFVPPKDCLYISIVCLAFNVAMLILLCYLFTYYAVLVRFSKFLPINKYFADLYEKGMLARSMPQGKPPIPQRNLK